MSRYKSPPGFHRHQCPVCSVVWEHRDVGPDKGKDDGPAAGHDCPTPGCSYLTDIITVRYLGRIRPAYTTQEVTAP